MHLFYVRWIPKVLDLQKFVSDPIFVPSGSPGWGPKLIK